MNEENMQQIEIAKLRTDGGTQSRAQIDMQVVQDYAEAMKDDAPFPAIVVFYDGETYWLADGFHRVEAAKHNLATVIESDVRQGTRRDAVLYSVGANADHGLRRTNADKRRAVETLLRDDEWREWSNAEIARRTGVDHKTVGKVRDDLSSTWEIPKTDTRKGADGRTRNTSNIGKSKKKNPAKVPPSVKPALPSDAPVFLRDWIDLGQAGVDQAIRLWSALRNLDTRICDVVEAHGVSDLDTITILARLLKNNSETFGEIEAAGYIQPGDEHEAVHISDGALAVQAALNLKAKAHKQLAADEKTERKTAAVEIENPYRVFCADIRNQPAEIEPESVDFIITDPPYPAEFIPLYGDLAQYAARVLKPGGSLLIMSGQMYKPQLYALVTPHLTYHWELAYLTPGGQSPQIWPRSVNTFWKPILWFVKGEYKGDWIGDVVSSEVNDNDKRFHKWGQSLSGIDELILKFTYPGQTILDPFVGGGTVAVSTVTANRRFVGFDIEQSAVNTTIERLQKLMEKSA